MLNREQTFFLSVLADHLNGRPTSPVSGLDWEAVYDTAVRHQVSALVCDQCGAFLPPEAELRFLRDFGAAVAAYAARRKIASDLDREFTRKHIPYVIVKGLAVSESYPQPELRTMGDVDVIVKAEDKERAHDLLLELGFHNTWKHDHEWIYWKDSCELELHHRLLYDEPANELSSLILADRMWEYVQVVPGSSRCELDATLHFLFLVMHLKKHMINSGAGFRQFMDLAVAVQKWPLEWSRLEAWFAEAELRSFAEICLTLCRTWFQLPLPFAGRELPPEFELEIGQQIFSNGVFGFSNPGNKSNFLIARINADGRDGVRWRFRVCLGILVRFPGRPPGKTWSLLFPGYEFLRKTERYAFVDRRPWLLPIAWSYRLLHCFWFHCFWFRVTQIWRILLLRSSAIRKRNETLKKMGLSVRRRIDEYDHH